MKIVTVVGARPQFIKSAPVTRAFREMGIAEVLVHTGQHYDDEMSDIFFRELGLAPPAYNLGIGSGSHARQTGGMLGALETVVLAERPDLLLIYGDTNSTLAGSLVGAKLCIPTAHVEAGLRSFNRRMPEEINRIVADVLSEILFVPTESARKNLESEGIVGNRVHVVGDVMFDVAVAYRERASLESDLLNRYRLETGRYVLATIHRAENTDDANRLRVIVEALLEIGQGIPVLWPLHPRTRIRLEELELLQRVERGLKAILPLGYLDMVCAEASAQLIVTDSGGVQKEAFFHGVPCVTVREETEWTELVDMGWNRLAPPVNQARVVDAVSSALNTRGRPGQPYGDGHAAERIAEIIIKRGNGSRS
jgi:UDP-GlcNAc3NAcA epimerase